MEIQAHLEINPEQIKTNFREVFTAIEKNSHSAYHIVCNLAHQDSGDYFISLEIGKDDNAQDRPPRGGGFGLTKAYYICKALGGKMYIDSPISENKGTRIKLTLPIP